MGESGRPELLHSVDPVLLAELTKLGPCVPVSRFTAEHTPLETVVVYFVRERGVSYRQVAKLCGRSTSIVLNALRNADRKQTTISIEPTAYSIPVSVLTNKRLSPAEAIIAHLREYYTLSFAQIARLLHRDARNVCSVYRTSQQKRGVHA